MEIKEYQGDDIDYDRFIEVKKSLSFFKIYF